MCFLKSQEQIQAEIEKESELQAHRKAQTKQATAEFRELLEAEQAKVPIYPDVVMNETPMPELNPTDYGHYSQEQLALIEKTFNDVLESFSLLKKHNAYFPESTGFKAALQSLLNLL
jgi:hypothetical protein